MTAEWEEKYHNVSKDFGIYKSEKEQKDSDDWMTMSYLTTENEKGKMEKQKMKCNSIWFSGNNSEIKSNHIAGHKMLFIHEERNSHYRAVLDYDTVQNIPVILDQERIVSELKSLGYPPLLTGEVVYIIQRTWPKDIGTYKKGDPFFVATAGSLKQVNFSFT